MKNGEQVLEKIRLSGILPVVKLADPSKAVALMQAFVKGGLHCIEVTFRAAGAEKAIAAISQAMPEAIVGAGTVMSIEQVKMAVSAGAKFMVSPGFNEAVVQYCVEQGIPVVPGVSTPTEITKGMAMGLEVLKFFPAEIFGGVKALQSFAGPFDSVRFIPTGGVDEQNLCEYLALGNVLACGGTWMAKEAMIEDDCFDEIAAITSQSVKAMLGLDLAHIGINSGSPEEAQKQAQAFCDLLGFSHRPGRSSDFAGSGIEIVKRQGPGERGHIGFAVNDVDRLYNWLSARGYAFDGQSRACDAKGTKNIYLRDEYAGFAIHFVRR